MNTLKSDTILDLPKFSAMPSAIHGKGLFADSLISQNSLICSEILRFKVGSVLKFDGPLRWVNHSSDPNTRLQVTFEEGGLKINLSLISICLIRPGEEITYNYSISGHGGKLRKCNCGNPTCSGKFHLRQEFNEAS